jgi:hypothetical protein
VVVEILKMLAVSASVNNLSAGSISHPSARNQQAKRPNAIAAVRVIVSIGMSLRENRHIGCIIALFV